MRSDCPFGAFYRRQKARLGPVQAVVATAHMIARVVYHMLKYPACSEQGRRVEYEPLSARDYEKRYRERQINYLHINLLNLASSSLPFELFLRKPLAVCVTDEHKEFDGVDAVGPHETSETPHHAELRVPSHCRTSLLSSA